ncbi:hypothetical protein ANRL4_04841 [Anaerolineae bacterium]|nr:hypothetical protein ANRL4_04841 [Anaerolineae bacterium]
MARVKSPTHLLAVLVVLFALILNFVLFNGGITPTSALQVTTTPFVSIPPSSPMTIPLRSIACTQTDFYFILSTIGLTQPNQRIELSLFAEKGAAIQQVTPLPLGSWEKRVVDRTWKWALIRMVKLVGEEIPFASLAINTAEIMSEMDDILSEPKGEPLREFTLIDPGEAEFIIHGTLGNSGRVKALMLRSPTGQTVTPSRAEIQICPDLFAGITRSDLSATTAVVESPTPVIVAPGGSISCGNLSVGEITNENAVNTYQFSGVEGQTIALMMKSVEALDMTLDPRIVLKTPGGRSLKVGEWQGSGKPSAYLIFTLPETATYRIEATRRGENTGSSQGKYELQVRCVVPRKEALKTGGGELSCGATAKGELIDNDWIDRYQFSGVEGQTIAVYMKSIEELDRILDPRIVLTTPGGRSLQLGEWQGSGKPSAYLIFTLPETATYMIEATRRSKEMGYAQGKYELQVRCVVPRKQAMQAGGGNLSCGVAAEGELTDSDWVDAYQFSGIEGQTIAVTMKSIEELDRTLDPRIVLKTPGGRSLQAGEWQGSGKPSAYITFVLPEKATYIIETTRRSEEFGASQGRYSVLVDCTGTKKP